MTLLRSMGAVLAMIVPAGRVASVDRKRIALYSYLALLVALVGVSIRFVLAEPYSDPPPMFEPGVLAFLILSSLHLLYFRRELAELRQGWVERHPWLHYLVRTEPESLGLRSMALSSVGWAILAVVLLTIWIVFIRA